MILSRSASCSLSTFRISSFEFCPIVARTFSSSEFLDSKHPKQQRKQRKRGTTRLSSTLSDGPKPLRSKSSSSIRSSNITDNKKFTTINTATPYQLCFLRHGQSTWNRDNRFIGWTDTPLTDDGVLEARVAGRMLCKSGMLFDEVHTSLLRRSIRTTNLVLMEMGQEYIPIYKNWRLNERNYGDLVGKNKKEVVRKFGAAQVKSWRRSYDNPPPKMDHSHEYWPGKDPRYRSMIDKIPCSESLHDTIQRSSVYWDEVISPALREGKTLLIVGHENNLRSLIMRLEDISKEDIINLSLPRAVPLAYRLDPVTLKPCKKLSKGKKDEATGFLSGDWLGGDDAVKQILNRDDKQVYDTNVTENLEEGENTDKWRTWMEFAIGKPDPEMKAKSAGSESGCGDQLQQLKKNQEKLNNSLRTGT